MNGVIYARYSSDNQREESIEGQIRECMEYAEKHGLTIVTSYIDRAMSAKTDNRPEFQKMLRDSSKKIFDVVLVWKLDRFSRSREDSALNKLILKNNGVSVISATENISDGPDGIILEAMLEAMAEYYSAELSEKIKRGMTENALKCKYNGGAMPLGYVKDENQYYAVDPLTAPIVVEIFTRYGDGETVKIITESLNERGLKTSLNSDFNKNSLHSMLKNRRYIGEYKYGTMITPNGIPAIIEEELFQSVQTRLDKNRKAPAMKKAKENYLLTTKLFCGLCEAFMVGESGTGRNKVHHYYKCVTAKKDKSCKKRTVKKDWIEDLVINEVVALINNDIVLEQIVNALLEYQSKESTTIPLLEKQHKETKKAIANMLDAIQQGIFNESTKQRLDELEDTKNKLEVSILQEKIEKPLLTKEQMLFWLHKFRGLDTTIPEQRQRLIDGFVNAIYLYDDKIVLTLNYKDGSKTITLADIAGSDFVGGSPPLVVV